MPEHITYYHDSFGTSAFSNRVGIALLETGATYTDHQFNVYDRPEWYTQVNPITRKVPAITYGGPKVHPEEPSPESFKLIESLVILEFLADLFPDSKLLPPVSDPIGRARVRLFIDVFVRSVEAFATEFYTGNSQVNDKIAEGLEKIQAMLPDPDAIGGEYAMGKDFTIADCAILPIMVYLDVATTTDLGLFEAGTGTKLGELLAADKFARFRRYKKAALERESVKKVLSRVQYENVLRAMFPRK